MCVQVDSGGTIYQLPAAKQGNGKMSILQEPVRDMQSFCTCDKLKWQTVLLCKNANSSLVLSKCIEDGNVPPSEGDNPYSEIWRSTNHRKDYLAACINYDAVEEKQDYKHFIVLRDPVDRFVSYANWHAACNAYLQPVIRNAAHETSLMVLFVLWLRTQDPGEGAKYPRLFDAHARLHSVSEAVLFRRDRAQLQVRGVNELAPRRYQFLLVLREAILDRFDVPEGRDLQECG